MKRQLKAAALFLLAITLTTTGCKKAKDGEPGADGIAGTNGTNGADGADGNANVVSSTYTIPASSSWAYASPAWSTNLTVPALTSANINTASVQVFVGTVADTWTAIPTTFYGSTNNYLMGFITTIGNIKVTWINNGVGAGSDPNSYFGTTTKFKVVVIPPGMITANPDLDLKNYNQLKGRFNLRD